MNATQNVQSNTLNVPDINTISLSGRVVVDPVTTNTQSGKTVCRFRFAYNPPKNAEQRQAEQNGGSANDTSIYYDVEIWDKLAQFIGDKVRKGSPLIIHGSLSISNWNDKTTGEPKQKTYIKAHKVDVLRLEDVRNGSAAGAGGNQYPAQGQAGGYSPAPPKAAYAQAPTQQYAQQAPPQQQYNNVNQNPAYNQGGYQPIPEDDIPF